MHPSLSDKFWARCALLIILHARPILFVSLILTFFFTYFLVQSEAGTQLRDFHRQDSLALIEDIEDDFNEGSYFTLIFEATTQESLLRPRLLKEQLRLIQAIKKNFDITSDSLVDAMDEGLLAIKRRSILDLEDDEYTPIAEGLIGLSHGRIVLDLEKVSRHLIYPADVVGFYEKFRVGLFASGAGRTPVNWKFAIPYVKAIKNYLQLNPKLKGKEAKKTLAQIRDFMDQSKIPPEMRVYIIGDNLISHDIDLRARQNAFWMALILILVDSLLLWAIFRRRQEVLITLTILTTACIWTFGMASLIGISLSFLHLLVLPILLGTGIDDSVVFGRRLTEELSKGSDLMRALQTTYGATGRSIFLTTCTTFIAFFFAGLVSSATAIQSFYFLVSFSMAVVFFVTIFLQGALRIELSRRGYGETHPFSVYSLKALQFLPQLGSRWIQSHPRRISALVSLAFVAGIALATQIQTESESRIFMDEKMPTYTTWKLDRKYFSPGNVGYILIEGDVANAELLKKMKELQERMVKYPIMEKILARPNVDSVNDLIYKMRIDMTREKSVVDVLDRITTSEKTANYVLNETYRESSKHLVRKRDGQYDGFLMKFFVEETSSRDVRKFCKALEKEMDDLGFDEIPGITTQIGGGDVSFHIEEGYYFRNMAESFFLALLLNFIVLLVAWRRFGHALLAVIPTLISVAVGLGLMTLTDVKLNVLNLCLGAIVVGLGIDYPIHIIERFMEERQRRGTLRQSSGQAKDTIAVQGRLKAAQTVLTTMGPNIFGASLTTIVGFAAACILAMPIAQSFGIFISITIFIVYVVSIFFLPILLSFRAKP